MTKITNLSHVQFQYLIDAAQLGHPYEICGLIGGRGETAIQIVPIQNVALNAQVRYEMDRHQMVATILDFQKAGLDVIAIYHSHPAGPAEPSPSDIAEATWTDALYIIIGLGNLEKPQVRAWHIQRGKAEEVEIRVGD